MQSWLLLFVAIISEVTATTSLKLSDGFTKLIPSLVVILGYGISFYCLAITLRTIPVGIVYAVWSGIGISLISIIGWVMLGQKLDMPAILGICLIVSGVLVIHVFSQAA
jgi:small multidrug resistance pump